MWTVQFQTKPLHDEGCVQHFHTFKRKKDAIACYGMLGASLGFDMTVACENAKHVKSEWERVSMSASGYFPFIVFWKGQEKGKPR